MLGAFKRLGLVGAIMIGGAVAIASTGAGFVVGLAGARVRGALVPAVLVFAALPAASALAATTVGQTGTPLSNNFLFGGREDVQTSAAVRAVGVVTSFNT